MEEQLSFETGSGFLLARLGSLAGRSWAGMLRDHNLTPHQHGVLLALRERGPLGQRSLSAAIAVDPRNVVPILDGLVARRLVARSVDPVDRRRRVVELTDAGRRAANALAASAAEIEREFLSGLAADEQRDLNRLLRALHAALGDGRERS
ncbi:MAG: MarR family transcriptional regulator [Pseudonocardiaceae bacterium]|nr:MarR family transcriptional regulator [Pseudonocardiaceae bacterium]